MSKAEDKIEQDKAFQKAYFALERTIKALLESKNAKTTILANIMWEAQGVPSEKALPPKGAGVALSTT